MATNAPICVTGATGWIAAFVVRDLLAEGHHVVGSVRSLKNEEKLAPLRALPGADKRLTLREADLMDPSTFDGLLEGCVGLIHTATPIEIPLDGSPPSNPEETQIKPAVEGTATLLKAAARHGVRRVVLTSSIAAMRVSKEPPKLFNEECWSDVSLLRSRLHTFGPAAYCLAKTLQEQEATRLCEALGLKLCVVNPALVIGPTLTPNNQNFSLLALAQLASGRGGSGLDTCRHGHVPDIIKGFVDVREVSEAHVRALLDPRASGRYLLQSHWAHYHDVARLYRCSHLWLRLCLPALPVDSPDGERHASVPPMDNSKAFRVLGVTQIPLETSVRDSAAALDQMGHRVAAPFAWKIAAVSAVVAVAAVFAQSAGGRKR
jgi:nucleoside-diphosphate-sugar epimerase